MKTTTALSISALLVALAAGPAAALDVNANAGASVGATVSGSGGDAGLSVNGDAGVGVNGSAGNDSLKVKDGTKVGATGGVEANGSSMGSDVDLDALIALIATSDYDQSSFSTWSKSSATMTSAINLDDRFDADAKAKIDAAVKAHAEEHTDLQAAIDANAGLKAWLDNNNIDADAVVAIDVNADGSVNVYEG